MKICTAHCLDLDLNGKRPGVDSDGNFSSYLIRRSRYGWLFPLLAEMEIILFIHLNNHLDRARGTLWIKFTFYVWVKKCHFLKIYFTFFQLLMFLLTLVFILLTILFTQELQGVKTTLPYLLATSVYYLTTGKVSCFFRRIPIRIFKEFRKNFAVNCFFRQEVDICQQCT